MRVSPSGIGARVPTSGVARIEIGLVYASIRNRVRRVAGLGGRGAMCTAQRTAVDV